MALMQVLTCTLLCIFAACTAAPFAKAQRAPVATAHSHEQAEFRQPDPDPRAVLLVEGADGGGTDMHSVARPFVVPAATVRGPVDSRQQAELERDIPASSMEDTVQQRSLKSPPQEDSSSATGAFRALLHGSKKPRKFPKCGSCRMVRCNRSRTYCSGHCRQKRKLFFCDSNSVGTPQCIIPEYDTPPTPADFADDDPDDIEDYDTVVVTVEAPYIGCVKSGNRPDGCPVRGTPVDIPGQGSTTVLASRCRSEPYVPICASPLLPFGVCECFYRAPRGTGRRSFGRSRFSSRFLRGPCRTTELAAGSGFGGAAGISVQPNGGVTRTWISDPEVADLEQEPQFEYNVTASVRSTDVDATMRIDLGVVDYRYDNSRVLRDGVEIGEDYDYDADPEAEVFDYVPEPVDPEEVDRYYSDEYNIILQG